MRLLLYIRYNFVSSSDVWLLRFEWFEIVQLYLASVWPNLF